MIHPFPFFPGVCNRSLEPGSLMQPLTSCLAIIQELAERRLRQRGLSEVEVNTLIIDNPAQIFGFVSKDRSL